MANFPLSHITVGGNTYDITHATILTCTIDVADFSGGAYLADAWLKGAADDLNVLSYSGKTLTDAYDDLVAGRPVYLAIEVNGSITDLIPLSVDAGGWQKIFYGVVSTTGHIYAFKVFDAAMLDDFPTKISKTADSASGGGGGVSLHTLSIYKNGDEISFANLAQSDTVELWDISAPNAAVTLDNTGLTNIIKVSPVVVKDDKFYGYISSWNTAYKELSLIYANSTQMYALTLSHQWNANWQVTSNRRLMTQ